MPDSKQESIEVCIPVAEGGNLPALQSLLPKAILYVHESREEECKGYGFEIRTHTVLESVGNEAKVRNFIIENSSADCVFLVNEYLAAVYRLVGNQRKVENTGVIEDVISTLHQCAIDLNLGMFTFPRTRNKLLIDAAYRPFQFTAGSTGVVGLRGRMRKQLFVSDFGPQAELDFVLDALRTQRICLQDNRFCFDFGKLPVIPPSREVASKLVKKWGPAINLKALGKGKGRKAAIKVSRYSSAFKEDA